MRPHVGRQPRIPTPAAKPNPADARAGVVDRTAASGRAMRARDAGVLPEVVFIDLEHGAANRAVSALPPVDELIAVFDVSCRYSGHGRAPGCYRPMSDFGIIPSHWRPKTDLGSVQARRSAASRPRRPSPHPTPLLSWPSNRHRRPSTTRSVFFDTLSVTRAPNASARAFASGRVMVASDAGEHDRICPTAAPSAVATSGCTSSSPPGRPAPPGCAARRRTPPARPRWRRRPA